MPIMLEIVNNAKLIDEGESPLRFATSSGEYRSICRLVEVSSIATFLRNFAVNVLSDEEQKRFFELQNYFIELEAKCFYEVGFV